MINPLIVAHRCLKLLAGQMDFFLFNIDALNMIVTTCPLGQFFVLKSLKELLLFLMQIVKNAGKSRKYCWLVCLFALSKHVFPGI